MNTERGGLFLNVGCGDRRIRGFVNIDRTRGAELRRDVTRGLPYADDTVEGIFSEHFLEHLSRRDGLRFLRECRRVLKPGGVVRIAMPDLDVMVSRYQSEDWRGDGDMFKIGYDWVDNRCQMLNLALREWGHQWVYNEEELARSAELAGLHPRGRMAWGESDDPRLRGLEYRPGSKLIMEFTKEGRRRAPAEALVSIVIPAYKEAFFEETLRSAIAQTYRHKEIIVCDDSRGRQIEETTRKCAGAMAEVRYVRNDPPEGPLGNYLKCLALARGDYLKIVNDDDVLEPECVARMAAALERSPTATLVACRRRWIDAGGQELRGAATAPPLATSDVEIEGRSLGGFLLAAGVNWVGEPSATMFRRSNALSMRPHMMSLAGMPAPGWGDFALNVNLLGMGNAIYLGEALCRIREHPGQWKRNPELRRRAAGTIHALRTHAVRLGLYRAAWGMPDPLVWIAGFRYRPLGTRGRWRRKRPGFRQWLVFARKLAQWLRWAARRAKQRQSPSERLDAGAANGGS